MQSYIQTQIVQFMKLKMVNVYDQCFKNKQLFDFSGYPKYSVYPDSLNKKVLGKMKDKLNGSKIV